MHRNHFYTGMYINFSVFLGVFGECINYFIISYLFDTYMLSQYWFTFNVKAKCKKHKNEL